MVLNRSRAPVPRLMLLDPDAAATSAAARAPYACRLPEAMTALRRDDPPFRLLVLSGFPGADTILQTLKADPLTRHVPVVVLARRPSAQEARECYRAGASCYLPRPGCPSAYAELLRSLEDFWLRGPVVLPHLVQQR